MKHYTLRVCHVIRRLYFIICNNIQHISTEKREFRVTPNPLLTLLHKCLYVSLGARGINLCLMPNKLWYNPFSHEQNIHHFFFYISVVLYIQACKCILYNTPYHTPSPIPTTYDILHMCIYDWRILIFPNIHHTCIMPVKLNIAVIFHIIRFQFPTVRYKVQLCVCVCLVYFPIVNCKHTFTQAWLHRTAVMFNVESYKI